MATETTSAPVRRFPDTSPAGGAGERPRDAR